LGYRKALASFGRPAAFHAPALIPKTPAKSKGKGGTTAPAFHAATWTGLKAGF